MAEFLLHEGRQKGSYRGAIYRDGAKEFRAFGSYAYVFYDDNGELNDVGKWLAKGEVPLIAYAHKGTYSTKEVFYEKNAGEQDIGWLSSLEYD
jgi:hypothetical protein